MVFITRDSSNPFSGNKYLWEAVHYIEEVKSTTNLFSERHFDIGLHKDMRKSSSPSLSNCNSVLTNKIFGIPLDELQQEGQPGSEVPFIVRHVVDYIEEHGMYFRPVP